jgi:NAD(P)-dependent dehydrogenase (short-subunit alcohol dehydrogenase family)
MEGEETMGIVERLFDVSGRTAIVTGASSGLGVAFSRAFSEAGMNVVLAARRTDRLEELAQELSKAGGEIEVATCDVADSSQVAAMANQAVRRFGGVDVLVNNAGQTDGGPVPEKHPEEMFEQIVRVNLNGLWFCCKQVGAHMLERGKGGSIINISSVLGLGGQQNYPPGYMATKAAVINLTKTLACSWADRQVRVNAIAPGWYPSEMSGPWLGNPAFLEFVESQTPMGRVGDPEELLGALLYLASDASKYVTGQTLAVDGGYSAGVGHCAMPQEIVSFIEAAVPDGLGVSIVPE